MPISNDTTRYSRIVRQCCRIAEIIVIVIPHHWEILLASDDVGAAEFVDKTALSH